MADKRISQLVDRGTVANNDVVPIVVSGATTTNKATISSIQTFMQGNLDLGVTSVGITLGSSGTDVSVSGSPVTSSGNITINLPTASATNRGLLSAADWTTFNNKANAGDYVTLATTQTITAQKTFTTSGSSDTMIISHGSGSGFALDVLKAGNGEAIRVTKSSGSGNAMTISGGNFEAGTIVKTGGTSSQFLKADGSVDSSTYLTTGSAGSTYVPYFGATSNVDLGVNTLTSSSVILNGSGSNAGIVHLESNAFFSLVNGYGSIASGTTNSFNLYQTTGAGVFRGAILSLNSITASATRTYTLPDADGTIALTSSLGAYLPLTGGTLTGALNGTSAVFSSTTEASTASTAAVVLSGGLGVAKNIRSAQNIIAEGAGGTIASLNGGDVQVYTSGNSNYSSISSPSSGNMVLKVNIGATPINALTLASTGAATFSSSVTANNLLVERAVSRNMLGISSIALPTSGAEEGVAVIKTNSNLWQMSLVGYAADSKGLRIYNTGGTGNTSLEVATGSGTAFIVNGSGAVGIGTATPVDALVVSGENKLISFEPAGDASFCGIRWSKNVAGGNVTAASIIGTNEGNFGRRGIAFSTGNFADFTTNAVERMRITSGGYLKASNNGVYTNATGTFHELTQNLNGASSAILTHGGTSDPYGLEVNFTGHDPNNATNYMFGAYKTSGGFVWIYRIFSNGTVSARSDARWKKNIETTRNGYIDDLCKLRVVKYNWYNHEDDAPKELGLIAQEVEEVFPNLIQVDPVIAKREVQQEDGTIIEEEFEDGVSRSIKTSVLPFMLLKAMQEQQEQIKELQSQIDSLKNQMQ